MICEALRQDAGRDFNNASLIEAGNGRLEDNFWDADTLDVQVDLVSFPL